MKLNRTGWIAWALALLLSLAPAGAADSCGSAPKAPRASAGAFRSVASLPGAETAVQGGKVTYSAAGLRLTGGRLAVGAPLAQSAAIRSLSLAPMDGVMGLDDRYNFYSGVQPVLVSARPANADASIAFVATSDPGILDWAVDEQGFLYLEARRAGRASVTIATANNRRTTRTFTVRASVPFSSMSIGELTGSGPSDYACVRVRSKTMYPGDSAQLLAQPRPYTATCYDAPYYDYYDYGTGAVDFHSSNQKAAVVSSSGALYALAPGRTTITAAARDGSNKKYRFPLTVKPFPPSRFEITSADVSLLPGMTHQMAWTIEPAGYYDQKVHWTSSDSSVARVDASGLVTAVSPYSLWPRRGNAAVITGRTNTGRLTAARTVTVTYDGSAFGTEYRFYGIGNDNYGSPMWNLPSCLNDLNLMASAMEDAGLGEGNIHPYRNQTGDGIRAVLQQMVADPGIGEHDVTMFFYSGHGSSSADPAYRGALCGTDMFSGDSGYVTVDEVRSYLDGVSGTVVVVIDSCLSGQFIAAKSASPAGNQAAAKAFNGAWVSGLSESRAAGFAAKSLPASTAGGKYKILTASRALELSWGGGTSDGFGWFTYWAGRGLGRVPRATGGGSTAGPLAADYNGDDVVTLQELYTYTAYNVIREWTPAARQLAQVWPAGDNFAVVNKFAG